MSTHRDHPLSLRHRLSQLHLNAGPDAFVTAEELLQRRKQADKERELHELEMASHPFQPKMVVTRSSRRKVKRPLSASKSSPHSNNGTKRVRASALSLWGVGGGGKIISYS